MNLKKTGALACAAAVLTVGVAYGSASASAAPVAVRTAVKPAEHHVKYSDEDIVGLLVFAKGKAADEHPDLAKQIRSRRSPQTSQVTLEQIAVFTKDLTAVDKDFHEKVTVAVQINDPFQAKAGMQRLNDDLKTFMTQHKSPAMKSPNRANGWFWHDAYIAIEINAVGAINAIGYANVAGATEAVVTLVVVPAAVSYGFDMSQPNSLDADNMVSAVAAAL